MSAVTQRLKRPLATNAHTMRTCSRVVAPQKTTAAASTRVVNYSSNLSSTTRVLGYLLFPVTIFHFRLEFFCSQMMNCCNLWTLGASRFHLSTCQPGNRSEYMHVGVLVQSPDPSAPGTLTHHPFFVLGSLYSSTSGINEYSSTRQGTWTSTRVLVKVLGRVLEYSLRNLDEYSTGKNSLAAARENHVQQRSTKRQKKDLEKCIS